MHQEDIPELLIVKHKFFTQIVLQLLSGYCGGGNPEELNSG